MLIVLGTTHDSSDVPDFNILLSPTNAEPMDKEK